MNSPDPEAISYLRVVFACGALVALLAAFAWGLRYFAARGWVGGSTSARKRLRMVEMLPLDARRRLVIVQCDGVEHLLLLGAAQDLVVSTSLSAPFSDKSMQNDDIKA